MNCIILKKMFLNASVYIYISHIYCFLFLWVVIIQKSKKKCFVLFVKMCTFVKVYIKGTVPGVEKESDDADYTGIAAILR